MSFNCRNILSKLKNFWDSSSLSFQFNRWFSTSLLVENTRDSLFVLQHQRNGLACQWTSVNAFMSLPESSRLPDLATYFKHLLIWWLFSHPLKIYLRHLIFITNFEVSLSWNMLNKILFKKSSTIAVRYKNVILEFMSIF